MSGTGARPDHRTRAVPRDRRRRRVGPGRAGAGSRPQLLRRGVERRGARRPVRLRPRVGRRRRRTHRHGPGGRSPARAVPLVVDPRARVHQPRRHRQTDRRRCHPERHSRHRRRLRQPLVVDHRDASDRRSGPGARAERGVRTRGVPCGPCGRRRIGPGLDAHDPAVAGVPPARGARTPTHRRSAGAVRGAGRRQRPLRALLGAGHRLVAHQATPSQPRPHGPAVASL